MLQQCYHDVINFIFFLLICLDKSNAIGTDYNDRTANELCTTFFKDTNTISREETVKMRKLERNNGYSARTVCKNCCLALLQASNWIVNCDSDM